MFECHISFLQFGGFSAESLADRILDAKCEVVITAGLFMKYDKTQLLGGSVSTVCIA